MNPNIGQQSTCFTQVLLIILCCLAHAGCAEVVHEEPKRNTAVAIKWLGDNYKPEYILVTENGRAQYLRSMGGTAVMESFGDEKFVLVNGVPVLTVNKEFLAKYQVGGAVVLDVVYVYRALTKDGLSAVSKKLEGVGMVQGDGSVIVRESESVCRAIYCNGFLFNCSLHPQFFSNTPGACPLCNLPLKIKSAP